MSETDPNSDYERALEFLFGRIDYERTPARKYGESEFKLDRMRRLLDLLHAPDSQLPIIHVAGTKGKGSTAAMIAAVLTAAGYRTGLYSSPHLYRVEERMSVDGRPCSAAELVDLVGRVRSGARRLEAEASSTEPGHGAPTYFELTTAMALCHFARQQVDAAVLEVGMGGRLDSTNVCRPQVTVITSISYDHTNHLGHTLRAIAREKAGIVKQGVPLVSGVTQTEPRLAIVETCLRLRAPLVELGRDFHFDYEPPRRLDVQDSRGVLDFCDESSGQRRTLGKIAVGLLGRHQAANAAVALATIGQLQQAGWRLDETAARRGLCEAHCPARVELVAREPTVVIDAAHNLASIQALLDTLGESFSPQRSILVFASTRDKDLAGMLRLLLPHFDEVIFTRYQNNPRGVPPEELAALAAGTAATAPIVCPDPVTAWEEARSRVGPEDLICVTGSFFIAAEMRREIDRQGSKPADRLVGESLSAR